MKQASKAMTSEGVEWFQIQLTAPQQSAAIYFLCFYQTMFSDIFPCERQEFVSMFGMNNCQWNNNEVWLQGPVNDYRPGWEYSRCVGTHIFTSIGFGHNKVVFVDCDGEN